MGGLHNVENATAAIGVAMQLGIGPAKIKAAVAAFRGVKRRFEYIVAPSAENDVVYVDDYAHHPAELEALIKSAASMFRGKKCTVIFQPHLFSRTRDFAAEFAQSLNLADEVILLPIYPARELPIEGVTSATIAGGMDLGRVSIMEKNELMHWMEQEYKNRENGLLITAGAGDIDKLVPEIKNILTGK
jgi:UDP-N-acetylmuramate--alanine ligase